MRLQSFMRMVVVLVVAMLFVTSCVRLIEEIPTPTPLPTPPGANRPTYQVKLGSIVQEIKALGRVASSKEQELYFKQAGRLANIRVEQGQKVKTNDLLAELETGDLKSQIAQAQIAIEIAQLQVEKAKYDESTANEQQRASQPGQLASASAQLASAEAAYAKAVTDLDKVDPSGSASLASARQAYIAADATVKNADDALARLKSKPTTDELKAAEVEVEKARTNLWSAQLDRDSTCGSNPTSIACQTKNATIGNSELTLNAALNALEKVKAGAKPEDISVAERALDTAKAARAAAYTRLSQLPESQNQDAELAKKQLASAKAARDAAKAKYDQTVEDSKAARPKTFIVSLQEKQLELAKLRLDQLNEQLAAAQIKAPFDGIVISTNGRAGDPIPAYRPVVAISDPKTLVIALDVSSVDMGKVQIGQPAKFVVTSLPAETFTSQVISIPSLGVSPAVGEGSGARTVRLTYNGPTTVEVGSLANVTIEVQNKANVLIIPNKVIRFFGGRRFVRVLSTTGRRQEVDVEVGINDTEFTEVVSGLREGQIVVEP